jgi:hypothetical protein
MLPIWFGFLEDYYQITYGLIFVLLMLLRPQGLIGRSTDRRMTLGNLRRQLTPAGRGGRSDG